MRCHNVSITNGAPGGSLVISANAVLTVLADSDSDHVPDVWMMQYFGHTNGWATDLSRAQDDPDGDGMLNWQEYQAGTDPQNPASVLRLGRLEFDGGRVTLDFHGVEGKAFSLESLDRLGATNWAPLMTFQIGTNLDVQLADPGGSNSLQRFYRMRLAP